MRPHGKIAEESEWYERFKPDADADAADDNEDEDEDGDEDDEVETASTAPTEALSCNLERIHQRIPRCTRVHSVHRVCS